MIHRLSPLFQPNRSPRERFDRRGSKGPPQQPHPVHHAGRDRKLPQLEIFGGHYDTIDGTGVRDYIHVVDLAQGHLRAIEYRADHTGVEAVNLGTGNGYSVLQVVDAFEKANGKTMKSEIVGRRKGDIAMCFADTSKALALFVWKAKRGIERMCFNTWRFISQNPDGLHDSKYSP
jgi:UDP-glucose 4-epimerase